MHVTFWGAARAVTGSMHLLELGDGRRILLDCGLYQGSDEALARNNRELPFDAASLDAVLVSHAHTDHTGMLPKLCADGFRGQIWATHATRDLCALLLMDGARIQEADARYHNRKVRGEGEPPAEPVFTQAHAEAALKRFVAVDYGAPFRPLDGVEVEFREAGHILGAATMTLTVREKGKTWRLGFTGDVGNPDPPVIRSAATMPDCDWLITESTYGGVTLPPRASAKEAIREVIARTHARGGRTLIPSFAVGRTQEVAYALNLLWSEGSLPRMPVFVDSPLAVNATEVFRLHPELFDDRTKALMEADPDPFGFEKLEYVRDAERSKAINAMEGPLVVIASSGMLEGGRILHHLRVAAGDPKNTVLVVGFQAENTLGRQVVEGAETVELFGREQPLRAEVVQLDVFAGHADEPALMEFIGRMDRERLRRVLLVHGPPERQDAFVQTLTAAGYRGAMAPERGQTVVLVE